MSERDDLARDLRAKYLRPNVPDNVAQRVFDKAWEDGHASGIHEVEMHYDDLSEIVNAAMVAQAVVNTPDAIEVCDLEHGHEGNAATVYGHHGSSRTCIRLKSTNEWVYDPGWEK